jgi:hypothetical protein
MIPFARPFSAPHLPLAALALLSFASLATTASAQCELQWDQRFERTGLGLEGFPSTPFASTLWDPDGPGPEQPQVVFGGDFGQPVGRMARWDGFAWRGFSAFFSSTIRALTTLPNGDLVAGGSFTGPQLRITRYDGTTWLPLGAGLDGTVHALAVSPTTGDLFVGGSFTTAGGAPAANIARWDGTSWHPLGSGVDGTVLALVVLPSGELVAGGEFTAAGGSPAQHVARWNGASWSSLGSGFSDDVLALELDAGGSVVAGGMFMSSGGAPLDRLARWTGSAWQSVGGGVSGTVRAIRRVGTSGDLIVGGDFLTAGFTTANRIARWNGTGWSAIGPAGSQGTSGPVRTLTELPNGDVAVAGSFLSVADDLLGRFVARFDTAGQWSVFGLGVDGNVQKILPLANGDVIVTGGFLRVGGVLARRIARWDGNAWHGLGFGSTSTTMHDVLELPGGDLLAHGIFGGTNGVARFDGNGWTIVGSYFNGEIDALARLPNGDFVAAGYFTVVGGTPMTRIARFDGSSWQPMGSGIDGPVDTLLVLDNGDLVAGGMFATAGGAPASNIARWDGASWSALGAGLNGGVRTLLELPQGGFLAGGLYTMSGTTQVGPVAHWTGSSWQPFGAAQSNGAVNCLTLGPDGDIIAGGGFSTLGAAVQTSLAVWRGGAWQALGGGTGQGPGGINSVAVTAAGALAIGGSFNVAGGEPAASYTELRSSCPAATVSSGLGCASSGGANLLTAGLPWGGSVWTATATGLPTTAVVVAALGFSTPVLPLSSVYPQALPGCDLQVAPEYLEFLVTTNGTASFSLFVPGLPVLAGLNFYHQMVPFEVVGSTVTEITATNRLTMTIGIY